MCWIKTAAGTDRLLFFFPIQYCQFSSVSSGSLGRDAVVCLLWSHSFRKGVFPISGIFLGGSLLYPFCFSFQGGTNPLSFFPLPRINFTSALCRGKVSCLSAGLWVCVTASRVKLVWRCLFLLSCVHSRRGSLGLWSWSFSSEAWLW